MQGRIRFCRRSARLFHEQPPPVNNNASGEERQDEDDMAVVRTKTFVVSDQCDLEGTAYSLHSGRLSLAHVFARCGYHRVYFVFVDRKRSNKIKRQKLLVKLLTRIRANNEIPAQVTAIRRKDKRNTWTRPFKV